MINHVAKMELLASIEASKDYEVLNYISFKNNVGVSTDLDNIVICNNMPEHLQDKVIHIDFIKKLKPLKYNILNGNIPNEYLIDDYVNLLIDEPEEILLNVNSNEFCTLLESASLSASAYNDKNGVLNQVNINKDNFASTDGNRLTVIKHNYIIDKELQIPLKAVKLLVKANKLLKSKQLIIKHDTINNNLHFIFDNEITIIVKQTEGNYPKYMQLIPNDNYTEINIDKQILIDTINQLKPYIDKDTNIIKFRVNTDDSITISTLSNNEINVKPSNVLYKDDVLFAVSYKYLLDAIKPMNKKSTVKITQGKHSLTPLLLSEQNNNDYVVLIMPIQIK